MLSRRREAGSRRGGGGGRGVAHRAEELEEGEACSSGGNGNGDGDGDGEAFFDPDVALSYIDEKVQHILGHFQKDFEGGVSAENLGSKYGGYGSFLPTYQPSPPLLPQSRSPHIAASRSPHHPSAEGVAENPSSMPVESIPRNKGSGAPLTSALLEMERCSSTNREESVADSDSLGSSFNGSDAKSLKVRPKICSNNALPRKNAAIYSGLGLDISSSSSMEESPDGLEGLSPEVSKVPYESPRTILQVMTCFPVPGGFLLSPLSGNLLQLTKNVAPLLQKRERHLDMENVPRAFEGHSESSLPPVPVRDHVAKQMKPVSMKKMSGDKKTMKDKGDISAIVNKEVKTGMPAGQGIISDMPAPTTAIKNESQFAHETTRNTGMSRPSERNEDVQLEEQIGGNDLAAVKDEAIKAEARKYTENSGFHHSQTSNLGQKGKPKIKKGKVDIDVEERDMSNHKSSLFDRKKKHKVKAEREFEAAMVDGEPCDDRNGDGNPQSEGKIIEKEHEVKGAASYDLVEADNYTHSSAAVINGENGTQQKSFSSENKAKSHKDLDEKLPNRNQGGMEGFLDNSAKLELRQKEKRMNINNENTYDVGSSRKDNTTRQLHMPSNGAVATANADPVPAPAVIKEQWVCCDICHKWRLLPYETNTSMLPKEWKCSMLYWLPGMNRCDISENETTDALNALYVTPATGTSVSTGGPRTAGAGTETSSAHNIGGQLEQSRKRKNSPSAGNGLVDSSYHTPLSVPLMSSQQDHPNKSKRTTDGERDSLSKHGLEPANKSTGLVSEKQKPKHKNHSSYSDEGDIMERTKAQSKMKSKRGLDRDKHKAYKKTKREDWHQIDRDQNHGRDSDGVEVPDEPKPLPAKGKNVKALDDPIAHENKKIGSETRQDSGFGHQLGMPFGKEKTHLRNDNQGVQNPVAQVVNLAKQKVSRTSLKPDSSKNKKSMRPVVENGVQHKQAISNPSDASPMRKDGTMVAFALKEARDLKHKANDLKNRGLELESTGLYFEAALKFLHVAFLLETPTFDTSRPGDATQSMKMYSETAKLCSFCAHEYERCKKMAAAALAYKCVEVAYLKAAYYKHPSASKDRQELQAAIQIAPGESPSSSASDIDNLNNSHVLSKAPLTKDQNLPQVAGNQLPLAVRNQAPLLRLLAYTNDMSRAFDATRKSAVAVASAVGSQERGKGVNDGLPSVKTVLDLNFNNVNELLRLVRLSMESISS